MDRLVVSLILGYLIGAVPFGFIAGRLLGVDVRRHGSGNIGATNVLRVIGARAAVPVLLLDAGKGVVTVYLARRLAVDFDPAWAGMLAGLAAIAGHNWSVFLGFKGGKGVATSAGVAVMLIPSVATIVPLFMMYKWIGWYNTHWTLIVSPALAQTFGTFLMRQFMMSIPVELEEAAYIDGASPFDVFWRIMLPLCKPALAVLAIFTFTGTWNAFFEPFVYVTSIKNFTVTLGLAFFKNQYVYTFHWLMAAGMASILPIIVLFFLAQRYFIEGIQLTGLKG